MHECKTWHLRSGLSISADSIIDGMTSVSDCLVEMGKVYRADPSKAVRGQTFISMLHNFLVEQLDARLLPSAKRLGIEIVTEAGLWGSHKPKNVDVAVVHPHNGPIMIIGVRSQMSSVAKNQPNYYEGIVGECISLQDRFPMSTTGYVYLMPVQPIKPGKEEERIDHPRYAKMYRAVTGRAGQDYKDIRGIYDQFAYLVVDFDKSPPKLRDDIVCKAIPDIDLSIGTFVNRMINTFAERMIFFDVFATKHR